MDNRTAAQRRLDHGAEFPYDAPDSWWKIAEPKPLPAMDWAHAAARGILADLTDRRGIKWALLEIDEDVRAELVASLAEIIRAALAQAEPVQSRAEAMQALRSVECVHTGMSYGDDKRGDRSDYTRGWGDCLKAVKDALAKLGGSNG